MLLRVFAAGFAGTIAGWITLGVIVMVLDIWERRDKEAQRLRNLAYLEHGKPLDADQTAIHERISDASIATLQDEQQRRYTAPQPWGSNPRQG